MNIFIILNVIGLLFSLLTLSKQYFKLNTLLMVLFSIILTLLAALRHPTAVGYDNEGHIRYFLFSSQSFSNALDFKEPGYGILSYISGFIGGYQTFLIIYSLIGFVILTYTLKKISLNPMLSLYLYFIAFYLGNNLAKLRYSFAMILILLAIYFIMNYRKKAALGTIFLAATFHTSALAFLLVFPLLKVNLNQSKMIFGLILALIIGNTGIIPFMYYDFIANNAYVLFDSINFLNIDGFLSYSQPSRELADFNFRWQDPGIIGYVYHLFIAIFYVITYPIAFQKLHDQPKYIRILHIYYWGLISFFLLADIWMFNSRISNYFLSTSIVVIPLLIFTSFKNKQYIAVLLIYVFVNIIRNYDIVHLFTPYLFFWQ